MQEGGGRSLVVKLRCGNAVSVSCSHPGGERRRKVVDRSEESTKRPCDVKKAGYILSESKQ